MIQRLFQRLGFHQVGVHRAAVDERVNPHPHALLIDMHQQFEPVPRHHPVAERNHFPEFPGGIDMQQRKRQFAGIKRLQRQVQHHGGVFSDRIQHHRVIELCHNLAQDVNRLGFQLLQVCQPRFVDHHSPHLVSSFQSYRSSTQEQSTP